MRKEVIFLCFLLVFFGVVAFGCSITGQAKRVCGNAVCEAGETAANCPKDCPLCGNRVIERGEECEGSNLGGKTCQSYGYNSGELICKIDCKIDTGRCLNVSPGCGDRSCVAGEDCNSCPQDCFKDTSDYCGDGVCNKGEDCKTCPADCVNGTIAASGTCSACLRGKCDGTCDPAKEGSKCRDCSPARNYCCGFNSCSSQYCGLNCGSEGQLLACCGNKVCETHENNTICSQDCLQTPPSTCTDTDNGKDYFVKGTCTDSSGTYIDRCSSDTGADDYYCASDGICSLIGINCDYYYGKVCKDGVCVDRNTSCSIGNITCTTNENCGIPYHSPKYCGSDGNVYQDHQQHLCEYPGTCTSYCRHQNVTYPIYHCYDAPCENGKCPCENDYPLCMSAGQQICIGNSVYKCAYRYAIMDAPPCFNVNLIETCADKCSAGACVAGAGCSDSDYGLNILDQGTCIDTQGSHTDSSPSTTTLNEWYCISPNSSCNQVTKNCANFGLVSESGRCLPSPGQSLPSCIDSDGSDYLIAGTCYDSSGELHIDSCNGISASDWYCTGYTTNSTVSITGNCATIGNSCSVFYKAVCVGGACVGGSYRCGNGLCEVTNGESCSTCAADCGVCPAACGDGICKPYQNGGLQDGFYCSKDCILTA